MSDITLEPESNSTEMKKPIDLQQLLMWLGGLVLSIFLGAMMYAQNDAKIKENHEQRIKSLEDNKAEIRARFDAVDAKLDKISDKIDAKQDKK